jgi:hypothetical protein
VSVTRKHPTHPKHPLTPLNTGYTTPARTPCLIQSAQVELNSVTSKPLPPPQVGHAVPAHFARVVPESYLVARRALLHAVVLDPARCPSLRQRRRGWGTAQPRRGSWVRVPTSKPEALTFSQSVYEDDPLRQGNDPSGVPGELSVRDAARTSWTSSAPIRPIAMSLHHSPRSLRSAAIHSGSLGDGVGHGVAQCAGQPL